jgi:hypothetical protein
MYLFCETPRISRPGLRKVTISKRGERRNIVCVMADSRDNKGRPPPSWPVQPPAGAAPVRPSTPVRKDPAPAKPGERDHNAGRIVHDERGNAVWNWVKETGRFCIDSTSALLKKLDFGDLKVEGEKDEGLRLEDPACRDAGGGYDPYNQKIAPRKGKPVPPKK